MPVPSHPSRSLVCVVCGTGDARVLSATTLESGAVVIVCGSHAVAHDRLSHAARSVTDLRAALGERRGLDCRDAETDELARQLALAFNPERRSSGRRREDTYSLD